MEPPGSPVPRKPGEEPGDGPDALPDEPESLEVEPVLAGRPNARRVVLGAAAGLAALLVGAVVVAEFAVPATQAPTGPQSPTPTPTSSAIDWPTPRPASPTPPRPSVFSASGFLADVDADVFVRSNRAVFRIDTRAGRVTRTGIQSLESAGSVSFLVTADRVLVRPMDATPGYAVVDDQAIRPLAGHLAGEGDYLPGRGGLIWVTSVNAGTSVARLTDTAGRRVYETIRTPGQSSFTSDGAGGLFVTDVGGTYQATRTGLRRVTDGAVVATSPHRYLIVECDERFACSTYLVDRRRPGRERIGAARMPQYTAGSLSPDGRYAAGLDWNRTDGPHLSVIDVRRGRVLTEWQLQESDGTAPAVWLPDGRLLGLANTRLFVFDPRTRSTIRPPIRFPPLRQLALRVPGG